MIGSVTDRRGHGKTILILGMPVDGETRPIKRQMLISTTWITTTTRLVWTRASWFHVICVDQEKAEVNVAALKHVAYLPSISWSVRRALIEQSTNQEFSVHFNFIVDHLRAWFTGLGQPKMTSRGKVAHRLVLDEKLPNRICNIDRSKTWYHWFITANKAFYGLICVWRTAHLTSLDHCSRQCGGRPKKKKLEMSSS